MCGIVGYVGKSDRTVHVLLRGLERLEYRGYDSAGIAVLKDHHVDVVKKSGKLDCLKACVDPEWKTEIGIGHTRWATHGSANQENAHPHQVGKVTAVHNGIIENMDEIKKELSQANVVFRSDTDSEVLVALLNRIYEKCGNMLMAIEKTMKKVVGSYAVALLCEDDEEHIYVMKKDSPLLLGVGKGEMFVASDYQAFCEDTKEYVLLDDFEYGVIGRSAWHVYKDGKEFQKKIEVLEEREELSEKGEYDCYMHKEIYDIPGVLSQLFLFYEKQDTHHIPDYTKYHKIQIVACGSAYHAGCVGKAFFSHIAHFPVEIEYASEYRYQPILADKDTLVIFVSQSGETADTIYCAKKIKELGIDSLAIVNVYNSTLSRLTDYVYYMRAGEERAVATTKGYSSQVALFLIILREWMQARKCWTASLEEEYQQGKRKLFEVFPTCLKKYEQFPWISKLTEQPMNFFIGRQIDYALSLEASLKLKEVTYLNSCAYPAGELKHGTISLIEKGTVVFAIATDLDTYEKTKSNLMEVKARGAYVILTTLEDVVKEVEADEWILVPNIGHLFQPMITILPFQLLSYHVAKSFDLDVDHPRNLAKSVTVE